MVKNKNRRVVFTPDGLPAPPQPILARWATWLEASFYYADSFHVMKEIVNSFEDCG